MLTPDLLPPESHKTPITYYENGKLGDGRHKASWIAGEGLLADPVLLLTFCDLDDAPLTDEGAGLVVTADIYKNKHLQASDVEVRCISNVFHYNRHLNAFAEMVTQ